VIGVADQRAMCVGFIGLFKYGGNMGHYKQFLELLKLRIIKPSKEDYDKVNRELNSNLNTEFVNEMTEQGIPVGSVVPISLLEKSSIPLIAEMLTPVDIIKTTRDYIKAGMRNNMVAFAFDFEGNAFCLDKLGLKTIQFFDHDFCKDYSITSSFDELFATYIKLIEGA
jgi:hypothetical protein